MTRIETGADGGRELDDLLAEARALEVVPSAALWARLAADAERERPRPRTVVPAVPPAPGGWRGWLRLLGGWPAVGGFVAATLAGIWIGAAPPTGVSSVLPSLWGEDVSVALGVDEDPLSLLEG
ncbi:hypothetical protein [Rubellimicrobium aerolatum]|uniref:Dihydroorotate dehydrogenase n=1 Tax=Rubellimicrobium aerolatum TaxID=490979 RepID=A0ABW0SAY3_9RHOB|nr:hypothetical protein [Rubellimicrobium aerolatum]MBP1805363.1 hypothetical protein [Rubellimicrobium aerolatum]